MGHTLVKSALLVGQWREINHKAFRLLVHMAVTALDTEVDGRAARLYWRGRQAQAMALGYSAMDCDSTGARTNVAKAIRELTRLELIAKIDGGFSGRAATYELLLRGDVASSDLLMPRKVQELSPEMFSTVLSTESAVAR